MPTLANFAPEIWEMINWCIRNPLEGSDLTADDLRMIAMSERWVVNASPLILLGKTDNLDLLGALADEVTTFCKYPDQART